MLPDLTLREAGMMASLIAVIFWLGLYPGPVLKTVEPVLKTLVHSASQEQASVFQEGRE
jgi:NADH:ubiquinone oxidoreductase subunit 4 (subunit M)